MLVIHVHAVHDLVATSFDSSGEVIVYASFSVGSVKKATAQKTYHTKNDSMVIFNEVKYFPVVVRKKTIIPKLSEQIPVHTIDVK